MEDHYPGMWQRWYRNQCIGIGWPPGDGYRLHGTTPGGKGWTQVRNALNKVVIGDKILVTLKNNRVGRVGTVTGKNIEDHEWNTLVPPSKDLPHGEMGRRILVRWDLTVGPDNRDMVVSLPPESQLSSYEVRPTIAEIRSISTDAMIGTMNDSSNWVGLLTHFDYERALSGYIAAYPHRLEDGLLPHPNEKIREKVFVDGTRSNVVLTDRNDLPVVVECKQGSPSVGHLKQIRNYMDRLRIETGLTPRGILVHGGARKISSEVANEALKDPRVEIVQYSLDVDFNNCN